MPGSARIPWKWLTRRTTAAFSIAGVLFLVNTIHEGIARYTTILGEPTFLNALIYLSALVISLGGLLGFYPLVADRSARFARLGAAVVATAGGVLIVLLVWATSSAVLGQSMPPFVLLLLTLVAIVCGFVLFGVTTLRTRTPSRVVGVLLLAFVGVWALGLILAIGVFGGNAPDWVAVFLNGASAGVLLAIGFDLRTGGDTAAGHGSTADATA